jgi:hypothetical protein
MRTTPSCCNAVSATRKKLTQCFGVLSPCGCTRPATTSAATSSRIELTSAGISCCGDVCGPESASSRPHSSLVQVWSRPLLNPMTRRTARSVKWTRVCLMARSTRRLACSATRTREKMYQMNQSSLPRCESESSSACPGECRTRHTQHACPVRHSERDDDSQSTDPCRWTPLSLATSQFRGFWKF